MGIEEHKTSESLFTKVQQNVLKVLYLNTDKNFYTNEIIRLTNCGNGAVQRELIRLTQAEIITSKQVGNQKHYQANHNLSYYEELRSIIIKTFGLADILSEKLLLNSKIKLAFIYGSFAKLTDKADSDIDLMVIADDLTYADLFQTLSELEETLGRKIHPTLYSAMEWMRKYQEENHFVRRVSEESKVYLIGTKDELEQLR